MNIYIFYKYNIIYISYSKLSKVNLNEETCSSASQHIEFSSSATESFHGDAFWVWLLFHARGKSSALWLGLINIFFESSRIEWLDGTCLDTLDSLHMFASFYEKLGHVGSFECPALLARSAALAWGPGELLDSLDSEAQGESPARGWCHCSYQASNISKISKVVSLFIWKISSIQEFFPLIFFRKEPGHNLPLPFRNPNGVRGPTRCCG